MRILTTISVLLVVLSACKRSMEQKSAKPEGEKPKVEEVPESKVILGDTLLRLQFKECSFLVDHIDMGWDRNFRAKNDSVCTVSGDTMEFNLYAGEWFYDREIRVEQEGFKIRKMSYCILDQVGVDSKRMIEVPFYVLDDWKSKRSAWITIAPKRGHYYFSPKNEPETSFSYTLEEFKEAVRNSWDEELALEMDTLTSLEYVSDYPFTTEYLFRIELEEQQTGKRIVKFLRFFTPTTC